MRTTSLPVTLKIMSTSSAPRNSCCTSGRMLTYSASSSVYFTRIVSGSGILSGLRSWLKLRNPRTATDEQFFLCALRLFSVPSVVSFLRGSSERGLLRQPLAHPVAQHFPINALSLQPCARRLDHRAHLLQ